MRRRHYAVMFLVLVVGVLTGFVVNPQQTPTRWEYGKLTLTTGPDGAIGIWVVDRARYANGVGEATVRGEREM